MSPRWYERWTSDRDERSAHRFADRVAAGRALADRLGSIDPPFDPASTVVLGLPRGGVPVAAAVAEQLGAQLDMLVAHKVGAPDNPELAVGAVATDGTTLVEPWAREVGVTGAGAFAVAAAAELERARDRERRLRGGRPAVSLAGRTAILVDDGMATGATMHVAILAARALGATRVVVAVPVAAAETAASMRHIADRVVTVLEPADFRAVGEWYDRFDQIDDADVARTLAAAAS
jgi:putative phosphoribosyl transferase